MELKEETIKIDTSIRKINKLLNNYTKEQLCSTELTLPRFYALWFISKLEPVNMGKLNENIMVSNSTLTVTVNHLVKEGFVERHRDENDRRVVLLKTTAKGKKQIQDLLEERQIFFQKSLRNIDPEQQEVIINILDIILNNLENDCKESK